MLLSDNGIFLRLMSASAPTLGQPETTLYDLLMGVWWEKVSGYESLVYRELLTLLDSLTT